MVDKTHVILHAHLIRKTKFICTKWSQDKARIELNIKPFLPHLPSDIAPKRLLFSALTVRSSLDSYVESILDKSLAHVLLVPAAYVFLMTKTTPPNVLKSLKIVATIPERTIALAIRVLYNASNMT